MSIYQMLLPFAQPLAKRGGALATRAGTSLTKFGKDLIKVGAPRASGGGAGAAGGARGTLGRGGRGGPPTKRSGKGSSGGGGDRSRSTTREAAEDAAEEAKKRSTFLNVLLYGAAGVGAFDTTRRFADFAGVNPFSPDPARQEYTAETLGDFLEVAGSDPRTIQLQMMERQAEQLLNQARGAQIASPLQDLVNDMAIKQRYSEAETQLLADILLKGR